MISPASVSQAKLMPACGRGNSRELAPGELEQIKIFPTVFADAGDFETICKFVANIAKLDTFVARKIN
jgi:hypothetical protein